MVEKLGHNFEAIRPRMDLVIHLEAAIPHGHGWLNAEVLTNRDLLQAHVRAHHPDPGDYDEPQIVGTPQGAEKGMG